MCGIDGAPGLNGPRPSDGSNVFSRGRIVHGLGAAVVSGDPFTVDEVCLPQLPGGLNTFRHRKYLSIDCSLLLIGVAGPSVPWTTSRAGERVACAGSLLSDPRRRRRLSDAFHDENAIVRHTLTMTSGRSIGRTVVPASGIFQDHQDVGVNYFAPAASCSRRVAAAGAEDVGFWPVMSRPSLTT